MLAIKSRWECPSCGNIIPTLEPFATKQQRKAAVMQDGPRRCGCGRKGGFKLLTFTTTSLVEDKTRNDVGEEGEAEEEGKEEVIPAKKAEAVPVKIE